MMKNKPVQLNGELVNSIALLAVMENTTTKSLIEEAITNLLDKRLSEGNGKKILSVGNYEVQVTRNE